MELHSDEPLLHVLFISGNSGVISLYKDFIEAAYELSEGKVSITAIANISHTRKNWENGRAPKFTSTNCDGGTPQLVATTGEIHYRAFSIFGFEQGLIKAVHDRYGCRISHSLCGHQFPFCFIGIITSMVYQLMDLYCSLGYMHSPAAVSYNEQCTLYGNDRM
ncbi:hypothetical protein Taro_043703 [Colocasia esculenta]|uniref:Uncharacterized protein n=1 Tax=Colocasia esculenta TaxID=4460 RepID=A0A843WS32_COLES|nr:hypothetical protein [Colocasia esculenta]